MAHVGQDAGYRLTDVEIVFDYDDGGHGATLGRRARLGLRV